MRKCTNCNKKYNWIQQLKEWNESYGDDWEGEALVNIICPNCDESDMIIELFENIETEMVESPALGKKVAIPKIKTS